MKIGKNTHHYDVYVIKENEYIFTFDFFTVEGVEGTNLADYEEHIENMSLSWFEEYEEIDLILGTHKTIIIKMIESLNKILNDDFSEFEENNGPFIYEKQEFKNTIKEKAIECIKFLTCLLTKYK